MEDGFQGIDILETMLKDVEDEIPVLRNRGKRHQRENMVLENGRDVCDGVRTLCKESKGLVERMGEFGGGCGNRLFEINENISDGRQRCVHVHQYTEFGADFVANVACGGTQFSHNREVHGVDSRVMRAEGFKGTHRLENMVKVFNETAVGRG